MLLLAFSDPSASLSIPESLISGFNRAVVYFREMAFGGNPVKKYKGPFNNSPVRQHYADFFPVDFGDRAPDDAAVNEIDHILRRFLGTYVLWVKRPAETRGSAHENGKNDKECFELHRAFSF